MKHAMTTTHSATGKRGEELGSGVLNVTKYLPFYTKGGKPRFIEGDQFVTIIPLPAEVEVSEKTTQETRVETVGGMSGKMSGKMSWKTPDKILQIIQNHPESTIPVIATTIGVATRTVERNIRVLRNAGRLRRVGPDKGGHWEVLPAEKTLEIPAGRRPE